MLLPFLMVNKDFHNGKKDVQNIGWRHIRKPTMKTLFVHNSINIFIKCYVVTTVII